MRILVASNQKYLYMKLVQRNVVCKHADNARFPTIHVQVYQNREKRILSNRLKTSIDRTFLL